MGFGRTIKLYSGATRNSESYAEFLGGEAIGRRGLTTLQ